MRSLEKKYYMKENKKRKGIKRQGEKRVWFRLIQIKLNTMHIVTAPKYISIIYFFVSFLQLLFLSFYFDFEFDYFHNHALVRFKRKVNKKRYFCYS